MRKRVLMPIGAAALGAGAIAVGSASTALTTTNAVPARLVGTWGKTITAATWHKNDVTYEPAGHFAIAIAKPGVTSIFLPPGRPNPNPLTTMHVTVSGRTVTFGPTADGFCPGNAIYRLSLSGRTLRFTVVKEDCAARRVLLSAGVFARG